MIPASIQLTHFRAISLLIVACWWLAGCTSEETKKEPAPATQEQKARVWITDFEAAKTAAKAEGKDLFIEFTGSDWCGPCIRLDREVLSQDAFLNAALPNYVLVKLDFPRDKSLTTSEIQEQNDALYERYQIEGFPSVILADATGRPYAEIEEYDAKLDDFLAILEQDRQKRVKRDEAIAAAEALDGVEKAKSLHAALKLTELKHGVIASFYDETLKTIIANDPDDTTGLARKGRAHERMLRFMDELNEIAATGEFEAVLPKIDEALKFQDFAPEDIQQLHLMRAITHGQLEQYDQAIQACDEAIAAMSDAPIIADIEQLKTDFASARDALAEED